MNLQHWYPPLMLLGYALSLTRLVSGWSLPLAVHNTGTSHPKIDLRYGDIYFYQPDSTGNIYFYQPDSTTRARVDSTHPAGKYFPFPRYRELKHGQTVTTVYT
jgi:hypothetical protein